MTDLPTRIEAGEATDAEVATALGWICERPRTRTRHGLWRGPNEPPSAYHSKDPPPFTTCLTTLAKECERRGWAWTLGKNVFHGYWHASINGVDADTAAVCLAASKATTTPALALCAALVRATETENG